MRKTLIVAAAVLAIADTDARAQVDLSAYADANGYIDVQALTCAQLANTWQGDADKFRLGIAAGTTALHTSTTSTCAKVKRSSIWLSNTARRIRTLGSSMRWR